MLTLLLGISCRIAQIKIDETFYIATIILDFLLFLTLIIAIFIV